MSLFWERRNIIGLFLVIGAGVTILIFAVSSSIAAQSAPEAVSVEDYKALVGVRSPAAKTEALEDPRVKEVLNASVLSRTDYQPLEKEDKVIVSTWGKRAASGSWQDGYSVSYTGGNVIEAIVDRNTNEVTSVNVTPREDKVSAWSFSDNQKKLISILVNDSSFQNEFAGKSDANDYFFSTVRNVAADDPESTGFIVITSPTDNKVIFFARIDPVEEKVLTAQRGFA